VREDLDGRAPRRMAVLDPIKVVLTNLEAAHEESIEFANHPKKPELGTRQVPFSREVWIERDDFAEIPPKGFHRLVPGGEVRLRGVGIVRCEEVIKNDAGSIRELRCTLDPSTRHGLPGADRKVKGTIHWVSAKHAISAEVRLYERLFSVPDPDDTSDGKTYAEHLNRDSKRVVRAWLEPSLSDAEPEENVQFERLGYFVADRHDHARAHPVFNRTVTLRDSFANPAR
jgi:glutaminyl-tRNA synthetase